MVFSSHLIQYLYAVSTRPGLVLVDSWSPEIYQNHSRMRAPKVLCLCRMLTVIQILDGI
jgi:hypothetical protein